MSLIFSTSRVATALWVCLALAVVIWISGFSALTVFGVTLLTRGVVLRLLAVAVVILMFLLLYQLARAAWTYAPPTSQPAPAATTAGEAFPSPSTDLAFAWLVVFAIGSVACVLLAVKPPSQGWLFVQLSKVAVFPDQQINEALVTMFGAGVGSAITTLLAFLRHASTQKDFDRAQLPFYVARPMMGMLLGLVFYFLIRGGLLLTLGSPKVATEALNVWGLAAIGALVGMFSKNAIDKLREIFHVIFETEGDVRQRLGETSEENRKKLLELLPDSVKAILMFGTAKQLEEALRSLPDGVKKKLRADLPSSMLSVLEPYLGANLLQQIRSLSSEEQEALLRVLPEPAKSAQLKGDNEMLEKALAGLTDEQKTAIGKAAVSEPTRKILAAHVGLDLLARLHQLDAAVQEALYTTLPAAARAAWLQNDASGVIAALDALTPKEATDLTARIPDTAKAIFTRHLAAYAAETKGAPRTDPASPTQG